jgi:hypothetical protein
MADAYPNSPAPGRTDTSAAAAQAMEGVSARVQRLVLAAIKSAGAVGLTAHELAVTLGMERTTVQPRTSELRRLGRISDSRQRRPNSNGKNAIVWIAREVDHG